MAEITLANATHTFGGQPLLDGTNLNVDRDERIGLLGRNGCGKSTLLRILAGTLELDGGNRILRPGLRVACLEQEVPRALQGTVRQQLEGALSVAPVEDWQVAELIQKTVALLGLGADEEVEHLSAGWKRRVLLAKALVVQPDLLLLDEPTNHLDLRAIRKLEEDLLRRPCALVFVTHDRTFLQRLATRIVALDRGRLTSYPGDYGRYRRMKEAELESEEAQNAVFDKKLAEEEVWVRRGIKARRKRNQGRVRALFALREQRAMRRDVVGRVNAKVQTAERTGQIVARVWNLTHSFDGAPPLIDDLTLEIQRGDRVGIVGPNGCGKTTLLRILFDGLKPDSGTMKLGTNLQVARFDQLHSTLDETKTVQENICDEGDMVTVGKKSRHVIGYLQDFLFTTDQIRGPVSKLSGGERNRLQLARILSRPCNVLILDEPTNDLDIETMELLEEILMDFDGSLLVVSHDRAFLDNVVTSTLVFEGQGKVNEFVGGYEDWQRHRNEQVKQEAKPKDKPKQKPKHKERPRRLSFKEQKELEALPGEIEALEEEKSALEAKMADPGLYKGGGTEIADATTRLAEISARLETAYARWEDLEAIVEATG